MFERLKRIVDVLKVSIRACEESRVLLWHRDKLKLILLTDPFLQAVFDHILGRDVVHKLVQVTSHSQPICRSKLTSDSFARLNPLSFLIDHFVEKKFI